MDRQQFQDNYDLLRADPDNILKFEEWQTFNKALEAFKDFCDSYDIECLEEIEHMLGQM